jgi:hypothetical protein
MNSLNVHRFVILDSAGIYHWYQVLEQLVFEFGRNLDQLGLPLREDLNKHWHTCMIGCVSKPGSYDEEHIHQTRNLGISREPHEIDIPDIIYCFGD